MSDDDKKDTTNVQEVVTELRAATPITAAMVGIYRQAMAMGWGDEAKSATVKVFENMLDVEVRR